MKRDLPILLALAVVILLPQLQSQQPAPNRVMGSVSAIAPDKREVSLRTDAGVVYGAIAEDNAQVLRIAPGERDMSKAEKIAFTDIAVGDRVLIRGEVNAENKTVVAKTLVIMSQSSLSAHKTQEQQDWKTRSLAGVVKQVDATKNEITLATRGGKEWTVAAPASATFMRYADDSVKYADAKPSSLDGVHAGDQLRVLGDKDEAASRIAAQSVVFGSFRTVAGEVKSLNAEKHEVTITDLQSKKPLIIAVGNDATLRKMAQFPMMGGGPRGPGGPGGPGGGMPMRAGGGPGGPGGPGGGPGMGGRGPDMERMVERLPAATFADLKTGDAVIVSVAKGADDAHVKAITFVAGMDFLLRASPAAVGQAVANWNLEMGMPQ